MNQIPLFPERRSETEFEIPLTKDKEQKSSMILFFITIGIFFFAGPNRSITPNKINFDGNHLKKNGSEKSFELSNKSNKEPLQV